MVPVTPKTIEINLGQLGALSEAYLGNDHPPGVAKPTCFRAVYRGLGPYLLTLIYIYIFIYYLLFAILKHVALFHDSEFDPITSFI